jgi:hypothetical protein
MVILFANEKARNQLISKGEVITLRQHRRSVGKDWATAKRGEGRICNVYITFLREFSGDGAITAENLAQYVAKSGFATAEEWLLAASYYFGKKGIYRAYIYHVQKIKGRGRL